MKCGIDSIKDIAEFSSYIITSLSLIGIWITYAWSKKQIHFSTMEKCTNDFRNILSLKDDKNQEDLAWQYIDLVNEEFFYLEKNYLPLGVCIEWIDGIIDYLPFYNFHGNLEESKNLSIINDPVFLLAMMANYPRIMRAIQLKEEIDFNVIHLPPMTEEDRMFRFNERNKLIYLIISSLKISRWRKLCLRRKVASR